MREKDPYPNNAFTISFDAKINPKLAGMKIEVKAQRFTLNVRNFFNIFILKALERTVKTVPTAIPAIARLI